MNNLSVNKTGYAVGILSVVFFLICSVWGVLLASPGLKEFHFNFLQVTFPGFSFTVLGYAIGLVEAFIYGWAAGALFAWLCKKVCVESKSE